MTFTLPSVTAILVLTIVAAVAGVVALVGGAAVFFARNHSVRVANQQSIPSYYRQLAFSH